MKSDSSADEHYQREKARRAKKAAPDSELMAAARREYQALLEAQAKKGKGGRPKKTAAKPATEDDEPLDDDVLDADAPNGADKEPGDDAEIEE